eukprot:GFYU01014414.1.p1 GENE.GFYU01014414.1~~GFYU01014414.1.p1  ORF type:complete len:552 (-),score=130.70 GFYU01014414.1:33-1688(-)
MGIVSGPHKVDGTPDFMNVEVFYVDDIDDIPGVSGKPSKAQMAVVIGIAMVILTIVFMLVYYLINMVRDIKVTTSLPLQQPQYRQHAIHRCKSVRGWFYPSLLGCTAKAQTLWHNHWRSSDYPLDMHSHMVDTGCGRGHVLIEWYGDEGSDAVDGRSEGSETRHTQSNRCCILLTTGDEVHNPSTPHMVNYLLQHYFSVAVVRPRTASLSWKHWSTLLHWELTPEDIKVSVDFIQRKYHITTACIIGGSGAGDAAVRFAASRSLLKDYRILPQSESLHQHHSNDTTATPRERDDVTSSQLCILGVIAVSNHFHAAYSMIENEADCVDVFHASKLRQRKIQVKRHESMLLESFNGGKQQLQTLMDSLHQAKSLLTFDETVVKMFNLYLQSNNTTNDTPAIADTWMDRSSLQLSEYYEEVSSQYVLRNVAVETLILQSIDDPYKAPKAIPVAEIISNSHILLITTSFGGHNAFVESIPLSARSLKFICSSSVARDVTTVTTEESRADNSNSGEVRSESRVSAGKASVVTPTWAERLCVEYCVEKHAKVSTPTQ